MALPLSHSSLSQDLQTPISEAVEWPTTRDLLRELKREPRRLAWAALVMSLFATSAFWWWVLQR
jgi:hypothetical protein